MESVIGGSEVGDVKVFISGPGGHTPEEWAQMATNKIIAVGDQSHDTIRAQAHAYREQIQRVIAHYIKTAIEHDRIYRG